MSMLQLDFLRHGETTLSHTLRGSTDDALTSVGWVQMQETLTQAVASGLRWDVIFTSPLQRCLVFAQAWAEQQKLPLIVNEHLPEMHFGDWEGQSTEKIYQKMPVLLANFWQFPSRFCRFLPCSHTYFFGFPTVTATSTALWMLLWEFTQI